MYKVRKYKRQMYITYFLAFVSLISFLFNPSTLYLYSAIIMLIYANLTYGMILFALLRIHEAYEQMISVCLLIMLIIALFIKL